MCAATRDCLLSFSTRIRHNLKRADDQAGADCAWGGGDVFGVVTFGS